MEGYESREEREKRGVREDECERRCREREHSDIGQSRRSNVWD